MMTINGYMLNPNAPNHEEAINYLTYLMDSYSEQDAMCLFPKKAEPIPDLHAELTGQEWLLSPGVIAWYQEARQNCIANATDLMNLFWNNGGIQLEGKYFDAMITTEQYILRAPVPAAMTPRVNFSAPGDASGTEVYKIDTDFSGAETRKGTLNLRRGPGRNYMILAAYKNGLTVQIIAKTSSSWYEVTAPDGKHGYSKVLS